MASPLAELDRRVSVLVEYLGWYEQHRRKLSEPTLDMLQVLRSYATEVGDGVDTVLADWLGDDEEGA